MTDIITNSSDEISLKELIQKAKDWWSFLIAQWLKIALVGLIGGLLGFFYAYIQPLSYTAKMTFVVEDGKSGSSGIGGLASLAGQFGVDVGGASGGNVLAGDNILLYFKSTSLAREVLLTPYDSASNLSLADVYSEVYELKDNWLSNGKIGKIDFPPSILNKVYTRKQDSLLQRIVDVIIKSHFAISRTDKKASFIEVSATMQNDTLAKIYCERIVQRAVDRYINIKTQRQKSTVDKLNLRVDSIAKLLRQKTLTGASLQTSSTTMDINPLYNTNSTVEVETTVRDKTLLATIFSSAVQNLELAKFTLSQETPSIQIVDTPMYPLLKNQVSKVKTAITFSLIFSIILIAVLVGRRIFHNFQLI
jgi:uncharacterized protein involved in exopolysaccharide biosynthesis